METRPRIIETPTATVQFIARNVVLARYRPDVQVGREEIAENLRARIAGLGEGPYGVIALFPEETDFELSLLSTDHYADEAMARSTSALAIVAEGTLYERFAHIYLNYHPTAFRAKVFADLTPAIAWVQEQVRAAPRPERNGA